MKFGNRLLEQLHGPWTAHYLQYYDIKQILKRILPLPTADGLAAEGEFLSLLLSNIRAVDAFFATKEVEYGVRLKELAEHLANPSSWLLSPLPIVDAEDVDLPQLVAGMKEGVHMPSAQKAALDSFIALCAEVDLLRKYSVLNSLAVAKIVKKHDKFSAIKLSTAVLDFVKTQAFTTSRSLATTFTHAQLVASEIITAATATKPDTVDYTCSICLDVLNMPVVISCAHRFCYGCLSKAALHNNTAHHCPLCKKETDLDPSHYEIDPVLNRFVRSHFRRASPGRASSPSDSPSQTLEPPQPAANAEPHRLDFGSDFESAPATKLEGTLKALPKAHDAKADAEQMHAAKAASFALGEAQRTQAAVHPAHSAAAAPTLPGTLPALHAASSLSYANLADLAASGAPISPPAPLDLIAAAQAVAPIAPISPPAPLNPIAAAQAVIAAAGAGNAPPTRKRACFECHRAKAACEGTPCLRCTRLGKHCFTEERKKRRRGGGGCGASSPVPQVPAAWGPTGQPDACAAPPLLPSMAPPSSLARPSPLGEGFSTTPPLSASQLAATLNGAPPPLAPEHVSVHTRRTAASVFRSESAVHGGEAWHYIHAMQPKPATAFVAEPPPPLDGCPGGTGAPTGAPGSFAYTVQQQAALQPHAASAGGFPQQPQPVAAALAPPLAAPMVAHDLSLAHQQAAAVAAAEAEADAALAEAELTGDADVLDAYLEWSGAELSRFFVEI